MILWSDCESVWGQVPLLRLVASPAFGRGGEYSLHAWENAECYRRSLASPAHFDISITSLPENPVCISCS